MVENLPKGIETGIYYGFASVDNGDVYKMVMSIGWNPYYHNEHKSMVSESIGVCDARDIIGTGLTDVNEYSH